MAGSEIETLERTALHALHLEHKGKLVPFAGYEMPVQFEGVKAEHIWTRTHAGLFDVSHMGPCAFKFREGVGSGDTDQDFEDLARRVEKVLPSNVAGLKPGRLRYTVLLNENGGIDDDLFIGRPSGGTREGELYFVFNSAVKEADIQKIGAALGDDVVLERYDQEASLLALQGPQAEAVLETIIPGVSALRFMDFKAFQYGAGRVVISRSGYTGEDGFEILVWNDQAVALATRLLAEPAVKPIGLGARDSLRLESGLCLYGHDMDASRDPVEANLHWVIQKSRRERADFPGATRILTAMANGAAQKRVGIQPLERAPAREGTAIEVSGERIGVITSGGFGPSVDRPIAMGYVRTDLAEPGTKIDLMVRGKARPAEVCDLPFIKQNYKR
ncbi:MAG: glycine cleavage system aminomethyltransferase GcvT [Henriciella sp.]